jgi:hypothetical protein
MPRVAIPVHSYSITGYPVGQPPFPVTADPTNHHEFVNDGRTIIEITNPDAATRVVTLLTVGEVDGVPTEDLTYTVPASTGAAATLTTVLTGSNNDLVYTADQNGTHGNLISVQYVDPGTPSAALSVSVVQDVNNPAITVSLATNGASAITSTATAVKNAIDAIPSAAILVNIANSGADTGAGVVTAMAKTFLTGGLGDRCEIGPWPQRITGALAQLNVAASTAVVFRARSIAL